MAATCQAKAYLIGGWESSVVRSCRQRRSGVEDNGGCHARHAPGDFQQRTWTWSESLLLGAFAGASLIRAIVGIAGVISYSVAQRTREIGVRVALGAERRTILATVLKQGGAWALPGIAIRITVAFIDALWLASVLYGGGAAAVLQPE